MAFNESSFKEIIKKFLDTPKDTNQSLAFRALMFGIKNKFKLLSIPIITILIIKLNAMNFFEKTEALIVKQFDVTSKVLNGCLTEHHISKGLIGFIKCAKQYSK